VSCTSGSRDNGHGPRWWNLVDPPCNISCRGNLHMTAPCIVAIPRGIVRQKGSSSSSSPCPVLLFSLTIRPFGELPAKAKALLQKPRYYCGFASTRILPVESTKLINSLASWWNMHARSKPAQYESTCSLQQNIILWIIRVTKGTEMYEWERVRERL
jgi:hypothetical protein